MRILFPAIRWSHDTGWDDYAETMRLGAELGVGGYIIFGGPAEGVRELTAELRRRSPHPLLIGADLERGAGQQFAGATPLPPPAAFAQLDDLNLTRRAGELTAREALAMGVNWVYAPVADLDLEPENPIVGTRAFGTEPDRAGRHVAAWIEGCRQGGALSCAKHFPGHGRTTADSHLQLPTVAASADELEADLAPFRAAIGAGVDSMMTAHVAYPALHDSRTPATLSRPILTGLLRERLGFDGIIVTDALIMEGVLEGATEGEAAIAALNAGCDALLYPKDLRGVADALEAARGGALPEDRLAAAEERIVAAADAVAERTEARAADSEPTRLWGRDGDDAWAVGVGERAIAPLRGRPRLPAGAELLVVDDDVGGPFPMRPGLRAAFIDELRDGGVVMEEVARPSGQRPVVVALYADIKGFKGRPGLSEAAIETVSAAVSVPMGATVVLFGHPRIAPEVPGGDVLGAWGGEPVMQRAAARWLRGHTPGSAQSS